MIFKSKKFRFVTCGLWVTACCLAVVACKQEVADRGTDGGIISNTLPSNVIVIRTALVRKIINHKGKNEATVDEIRRYDLNLTDDPEYKNSKEWSVFEEGKRSSEYNERFRSLLKSLSDEKYVMSLGNRIDGAGTDQPDLLFILPDIEENFCKALLRSVLNIKYNAVVDVPEHISGLNLSSYSKMVDYGAIVTIPENPSPIGCLKSQGKFYYYQILYEL